MKNIVYLYIVIFFFLSPLQATENLQDVNFKPSLAELAEENLPLYLTYLRINQKAPIQNLELMGGFGLNTSTKTSPYRLKFDMLFLMGENIAKPSELFYISQYKEAIQTAKIQWTSIEYGIHRAVVEFDIPSNEELSRIQLLISPDKENWYSYIIINRGFVVYLARESALPMELNQDGYPINQCQKIIQNMQ